MMLRPDFTHWRSLQLVLHLSFFSRLLIATALMTISDRILGKKNMNGQPHIEAVTPAAAFPGGEVRIWAAVCAPPTCAVPGSLW